MNRSRVNRSTKNYPHWTVLIVDDQVDNLVVAQVALKFEGAQVHTARNGEEGLAALHTLCPTFILLDLSMPKMDGWEMFRLTRGRPETAHIPVIALTAHAMDGDEERVLAAGFNGYIAKPFDVTTLAAQIHAIVGDVGLTNETQLIGSDR